jgi:hypothetical protein
MIEMCAPVALLGEFFDEDFWVNHYTIPNDTDLAVMQDPGGNQSYNRLLAADDERMAGVTATLEACDDVSFTCQEINNFSFPFISPLDADDDERTHNASLL